MMVFSSAPPFAKTGPVSIEKMRFSQSFVALAMALSGAQALTMNSDSCLNGMSCFIINTCKSTTDS